MSDLVNELTSRTGISPELVQKGLGALLSFLKKELGEETFDKVQSSIPEAACAHLALRVSTRVIGSRPVARQSLRRGFGAGGQGAGRQGR